MAPRSSHNHATGTPNIGTLSTRAMTNSATLSLAVNVNQQQQQPSGSKTVGEERVTRARASLTHQSIAPVVEKQQHPAKHESPGEALAKGKRKRTISAAIDGAKTDGTAAEPSSQVHPARLMTPILPRHTAAPQVSATVPVAPSDRKTRHGSNGAVVAVGHPAALPVEQRRAIPSSAAENGTQAPVLRKLKLRLSTLPEKTPKAHNGKALPVVSASGQPNAKRQRTQSMSSLIRLGNTNSSAFPFDNLHLLMQSGNSCSSNHLHALPPASGTLFPLDIHNLSSPGGPAGLPHHLAHSLDLLTSRSAPDSNIFSSPPVTAASFVAGPFSRRGSPSASAVPLNGMSHHRSRTAESSFASSGLDTPGQDMLMDDDVVTNNSYYTQRNLTLTDSTILAVQRELSRALGGSALDDDSDKDFSTIPTPGDDLDADFHESMVRDDEIDFAFDFSLDSLDLFSRQRDHLATLLLEEHIADEDDEREKERSQSSLDLRSLSDDVDGVFESLRCSSPAEVDVEKEVEGDRKNAVESQKPKDHKASLLEGEALQRALNTTLCPAACKLDGSKPSRLLARRMNSSSSLTFPKLSQPGSFRSPDRKPGTLSRNPSKDVLNTPIPLVELPSIPLPSSNNPILLYEQSEDNDADLETEIHSDDRTGTSPLTPIIKAEEDADEFIELANRRRLSRSYSSNLMEEEESSTDSFNPETMVVPREASVSTSLAEGDDAEEARERSASRSQSSSRTTTLSPRDSFSPQAQLGPNADWALTPPSEEEIIDDEEKTLDRAAVLGPESVGMKDLDDAWPGSLSSSLLPREMGTSAEIMEVFEPILSSAPLPQVDIPAWSSTRVSTTPPLTVKQEEPSTSEAPMEMDENTAAAMFIADEAQLSHPSITVPVESTSIEAQVSVMSATVVDVQPTTAADASVSTSTQSFLFYPETPIEPNMSILLTETKILFYSTPVIVDGEAKPLLRRVDNDAVDAETLLSALQGTSDAEIEAEREHALGKIRNLGNSWVAIGFAREMLAQFGGNKSPLKGFLADDILLHWNDKLIKLGSMLRQKNGLHVPTAAIARVSASPAPTSSTPQPIQPAPASITAPKSSPAKVKQRVESPSKASAVKSIEEKEIKGVLSSSPSSKKKAIPATATPVAEQTAKVVNRRSTRNKTAA